MSIHKKEEDGCASMIGALILLVAIYFGGGLLLQYVLGTFGVHISYAASVATFFLVKYLLAR